VRVKNRKISMNKNRLTLLTTGLCAVGLFTGMLSVAQATIAFAPPALNSFTAEPVGNDGLFFTPTTAISVTALLYAAPGAKGNPVGIYRVSDSVLLASTTVYNSSTLTGAWFKESITPITLSAGVQYAVVGFFTGHGDTGYTADIGVGAAPSITYQEYKYDYNSSFNLPVNGYSPAIFGPNFEFTPVPEPTTMVAGALLLLPVGFQCIRHLRHRK
jgi:hypothetical protein